MSDNVIAGRFAQLMMAFRIFQDPFNPIRQILSVKWFRQVACLLMKHHIWDTANFKANNRRSTSLSFHNNVAERLLT